MGELAALQVQLARVRSLIAAVEAAPKPSYNQEGKAVSWTEYLKILYDREKDLAHRVAMYSAGTGTYLKELL